MLWIKNGKAYDVAKFVALVLLPAVGTLYFALAGTWSLPDAKKVVDSILAVDTFLGVILHLSTQAFNASDAKYDGALDVNETDTKQIFGLTINTPPEALAKQDSIVLKVNPKPTTAVVETPPTTDAHGF